MSSHQILGCPSDYCCVGTSDSTTASEETVNIHPASILGLARSCVSYDMSVCDKEWIVIFTVSVIDDKTSSKTLWVAVRVESLYGHGRIHQLL